MELHWNKWPSTPNLTHFLCFRQMESIWYSAAIDTTAERATPIFL